MKKYWLIILLAISFSALLAQPLIPDSLRLLLQKSPDDSTKVKRLIIATQYLAYTQADAALYYADTIIRISEKIDYDYGIGNGYTIKAESYVYSGDYSKAIICTYQALRIFEASRDRPGIGTAYYQLSEIYYELGEYNKALDFGLKAREIITSSGDSTYNRLYERFARTDSVLIYNDYNIANIYLGMQMADSALPYGKRVFAGYNYWSATTVLMGDIYSMKSDYLSALMYYNTKSSENYPVDSAKNYIGKANVFKRINQPDSCNLFALKALEISLRINYAKGVWQASEILSSINEESDPKEALRYSKISKAVKDSLYNKGRINQVNSIAFNDDLRKLDAIAAEKAAGNRFRIWTLFGIIFTLLITGFLLWRNNRHKKNANILLQREKQTVEQTLEKLKATQSQLIQSEKMASLGELTAGIAHEIQNPLNFVNNFSEVSNELIVEMVDEVDKGNTTEAKAIANDIRQNLEKINHHGKRADSIVKGMLQHSRSNAGQKELSDINALADEYLRLSYHGLRAKHKDFNATIKTGFDNSIGKINIVPQDIGRVLLNLYNNAFYAVNEKRKMKQDSYEPIVTITTKRNDDGVAIKVEDNGPGIPENMLGKVFQPFFTTKPTGQGTGLGLSLSYDIIKAHGGEIIVESKEGEGTTFTINLNV